MSTNQQPDDPSSSPASSDSTEMAPILRKKRRQVVPDTADDSDAEEDVPPTAKDLSPGPSREQSVQPVPTLAVEPGPTPPSRQSTSDEDPAPTYTTRKSRKHRVVDSDEEEVVVKKGRLSKGKARAESVDEDEESGDEVDPDRVSQIPFNRRCMTELSISSSHT